MIESDRPSLLDIITFQPDIKIVESFSYPVGSVCLLQKGQETCVFNIDSYFGYLNTVHSPFQEPENTIPIYSFFFLGRLRDGNFKRIDFDSIPNIRNRITPDFIQVRPGFEVNKINP